MQQLTKAHLEEISRNLTDQGKLIEAGWIGLCIALRFNENTINAIRGQEMRKAFFAGAQHLFSSIMTILEPGSEPTEKDLRRMDLIHTELEEFLREFKKEVLT